MVCVLQLPVTAQVWGTPTGTYSHPHVGAELARYRQQPNAPTSVVTGAQPPKQPSLHRAPEQKHTGTPHHAGEKLRHVVMQDHMQSTTEVGPAPLPPPIPKLVLQHPNSSIQRQDKKPCHSPCFPYRHMPADMGRAGILPDPQRALLEGWSCSTTSEKPLIKSNTLPRSKPETPLAPRNTLQQLITALSKDADTLPASRAMPASAPFTLCGQEPNPGEQWGSTDAVSLTVHAAAGSCHPRKTQDSRVQP